MAERKKRPPVLLGDKCRAIKIVSGRTLICWKSSGHVFSHNEEKQRHYDPSADRYWAD